MAAHPTCRRCKGSGEYGGYGICYGCQGRGVIVPERTVFTPEEIAADAEYRKGLEARAMREAARKARMAARRA